MKEEEEKMSSLGLRNVSRGGRTVADSVQDRLVQQYVDQEVDAKRMRGLDGSAMTPQGNQDVVAQALIATGTNQQNPSVDESVVKTEEFRQLADSTQLNNGNLQFNIAPKSGYMPLDKIEMVFNIRMRKDSGAGASVAVTDADKVYLLNGWLLAYLRQHMTVSLIRGEDKVEQRNLLVEQDHQIWLEQFRYHSKYGKYFMEKEMKDKYHAVVPWRYYNLFAGTDAANMNTPGSRTKERPHNKSVTLVVGSMQKLGEDWAKSVGNTDDGHRFSIPLHLVSDLFRAGILPPNVGLQIKIDAPISKNEFTPYYETYKTLAQANTAPSVFFFEFIKVNNNDTYVTFLVNTLSEISREVFERQFAVDMQKPISQHTIFKLTAHQIKRGTTESLPLPLPRPNQAPHFVALYLTSEDNFRHRSPYTTFLDNDFLRLVREVTFENANIATLTPRANAKGCDLDNDQDKKSMYDSLWRYGLGQEQYLASNLAGRMILNGSHKKVWEDIPVDEEDFMKMGTILHNEPVIFPFDSTWGQYGFDRQPTLPPNSNTSLIFKFRDALEQDMVMVAVFAYVGQYFLANVNGIYQIRWAGSIDAKQL